MTSCTVDWERIESHYRAGVMSLREIASEHSITEGSIRKRAKRDGWDRDLSAKIKAKADALVRKSEYAEGTQITEARTIDANAQAIMAIRLKHRHDIRRTSALLAKLLDELEVVDGMDLRAKIVCAKAVSDTLKNLIGLESDAWGFATQPDAPPPQAAVDPVEGARRLAFALAKANDALPATVH